MAGISKLFVFSKDTDAVASLRGYHYQVLKAIEAWLDNYKKGGDDEIYCDYEEDIFQKDRIAKTAKFRQIKLYSTNFSFASKEVTKCIAHFFMLHVKTDYTSLDKEFVFEANTSVAQKKGDNDADLLREWSQNQGHLSPDLEKKCSEKVKTIVSEYVRVQTTALEDKEEKGVIDDALQVFNALTDEDWVEFTRQIRWRFKGVPADEEFSDLKERIEKSILSLPFPVYREGLPSVFSLLHSFAWDRASQTQPEDRKLIPESLEQVMLQSADKEEKWYWNIYRRWKDSQPTEFVIGEFYGIIDAVKHCRHHPYLSDHDSHWLDILKQYIEKVEAPRHVKRVAVYEYLWLRLRPVDYYSDPKGDILGEEKRLEYYFANFNDFRNASELEDAQNLINIVYGSTFNGKSDMPREKVESWFDQLRAVLSGRIEAETNPNEACHLIENLATYYIWKEANSDAIGDIAPITSLLDTILHQVGQAHFYDASRLYKRLNAYVSLLITLDPEGNEVLIEAIESISIKLQPLIEQRGGSFALAKVEIEKGVQYLHSDNPRLFLKALNCFHKAKDLWYHQEYIEGYVLALLNISQLYAAIGMNLAAKYYALGAVHVCRHNGSRQLIKRIPDALGLSYDSDFRQGAWMNAVVSFADYMDARMEFKDTPLDVEVEEMPFKIMGDFTILLLAVPMAAPHMRVMIDTHIAQLGDIGDDIIVPFLEKLGRDYPTNEQVKTLLERKLSDAPLNDVGPTRYVRFSALGSEWTVSFPNDYETNAIAEEFCGHLQVMLTEIAISKWDFHLVKGNISIQLEVREGPNPPDQVPSHTEFRWRGFIQRCDRTTEKEVNMHMAMGSVTLMYILEELSLLPMEEFRDGFTRLFKENDLAGKMFVRGLYQRTYRQTIAKERFDRVQREHFDPSSNINLNLPKENKVLAWSSALSKKYNHEDAVNHIAARFHNSYKCVHITLGKLKGDERFREFIIGLRREGWLDWQIVLAIMNFMLGYKAYRKAESEVFENDTQAREFHQRAFNELLQQDEREYYVQFPVDAFLSKDFKFQLKHTLVIILESYGLENNARFPNFQAIKELLDVRFNMALDNSQDGNPLADIV